MKKKHIILVAIMVVSVGGLVWYLNSSHGAGKVRMAYPPIVASLPVFIAEENDLLQAQGVPAETVQFSSSNDMVNALVAKEIDMLPAVSLIPILHLEIQHPGTVRLFSHSRMTPDNAFDSIIAKDSSGINGVKDLKGKKIGLFPGTSATNMLKHFLVKRGVDADSVTFVALAPPAQMSSLQSGAVDALFTYEPITTIAKKTGGYRQVFGSVYADLLNPCPIGCSVISRDFERKQPQLAARSIKVIDAAVTKMRQEPDNAKALLTKYAKVEEDIAPRVNVVDVTLSTEVDVSNLQRFIDLLHETGEIPKKLDAKTLVEPTK